MYRYEFTQDGTNEKTAIVGEYGKYFILFGIQKDGHETSSAGPFQYYVDARVRLKELRPYSHISKAENL